MLVRDCARHAFVACLLIVWQLTIFLVKKAFVKIAQFNDDEVYTPNEYVVEYVVIQIHYNEYVVYYNSFPKCDIMIMVANHIYAWNIV